MNVKEEGSVYGVINHFKITIRAAGCTGGEADAELDTLSRTERHRQ
jgi:hypothetical protein